MDRFWVGIGNPSFTVGALVGVPAGCRGSSFRKMLQLLEIGHGRGWVGGVGDGPCGLEGAEFAHGAVVAGFPTESAFLVTSGVVGIGALHGQRNEALIVPPGADQALDGQAFEDALRTSGVAHGMEKLDHASFSV